MDLAELDAQRNIPAGTRVSRAYETVKLTVIVVVRFTCNNPLTGATLAVISTSNLYEPGARTPSLAPR